MEKGALQAALLLTWLLKNLLTDSQLDVKTPFGYTLREVSAVIPEGFGDL